jgi:outer membrane lipoprotein-sorting protein
MKKRLCVVVFLSVFLIVGLGTQVLADSPAYETVKGAFDYARGKTSISKVKMVIHRPDWTRTMVLKCQTKGQHDSLFYITEPKENFGSGTLKNEHGMWSFDPKINRTVRIPPSMMSQDWNGSDFSNNDLSKNEDELKLYTHKVIGSETNDGKKVDVIESIPKKGAPVTWGMIKFYIREDKIIVKSEFFDEDFKLVKKMTASQIQMMGGKLFAKFGKMEEASMSSKYTTIEYENITFDKEISDRVFTIFSLQNPR